MVRLRARASCYTWPCKSTARRCLPRLEFQEIKIDDPIPLYTYLVHQIRELYPDLAYLHVTEPRVVGLESKDPVNEVSDSNQLLGDKRLTMIIDHSLTTLFGRSGLLGRTSAQAGTPVISPSSTIASVLLSLVRS